MQRNYSQLKNSMFFAAALLFIAFQMNAAEARAQVDGGVSISPPKMELTIPAGTEKTVGMIVDYTRDFPQAKLPIARLVARLEDWTVLPDGDVKFLPVGSVPRSAAKWVTHNPPEFAMTGDTRQVIRFTVAVPKDTAPGDYYFACYVESRTAPPPPKEGERQIYIGFRYYMIAYVMVPGLTKDAEVKGLEAKIVNGFPVVVPQMENKGNSHVRPKHQIEIRDAANKVVFSSQMSEALVVLGGQNWKKPYPIDTELPAGKYKLTYTVDFQDKKELQVGNTEFVVTDEDVATRKKAVDEKIAADENKAKPAIAATAPANNPAAETPPTKTPAAASPAPTALTTVKKP